MRFQLKNIYVFITHYQLIPEPGLFQIYGEISQEDIRDRILIIAREVRLATGGRKPQKRLRYLIS